MDKIHHTHLIQDIGLSRWNLLKSPNHPYSLPFLSYHFLWALEQSQCIGGQSGQRPSYFYHQNGGILFTFEKHHSLGEYIFDWEWAHAYQKSLIPYYPKLTSMIPWTPVTTPHLLIPSTLENRESVAAQLLECYEEFYQSHQFSSSHFLFLHPQERSFFKDHHYFLRKSIQYHFYNENYSSFDDFLRQLKPKKAKQICKERNFPHLTIECFTGKQLSTLHAQEMYEFYLSTIKHKHSYAYLNLSFFKLVFAALSDHILYIRASKSGHPIAGSLFFFDSQTLYGRYWGSHEFMANLHFELCYYQGIEFCIKNKIKVFEAGAQGEHKIVRGFKPVFTYSAHKLKHPHFSKIIGSFIEQESKELEIILSELIRALPFKD